MILAGLALLAGLVYSLPPVQRRLGWRVDFALAYALGVLDPVEAPPTPLPPPAMAVTSMPQASPTPSPSPEPTLSPTPGATPTPTPSPTPIPVQVILTPPTWEKQDINNCGPASLAMALRYYGWEGDQFDIADLLKPQREDRNVNVEELHYYVLTQVNWLRLEYRVGGDHAQLKSLIAAGLPVLVEEGFLFEESYWPNDDRWAAHYNLLTGYDDERGVFIAQDSFYGADQAVPYEEQLDLWRSFNYVYIVLYPTEQEALVQSLLGPDWDADYNRQQALEKAQTEVQADPQDAYSWFNLGSNLVYFERYREVAEAYDQARQIGLPQRMFRYQFGPFFAYFHTRRIDDLLALTEYALRITKNAEEAFLWQGWGLYRQGKSTAAIESFQAALAENPNYQDARYAIDFVYANP